MTRPIPPLTPFASKLALLATLTVFVPAAARLALMFWIQVPWRAALLASSWMPRGYHSGRKRDRF